MAEVAGPDEESTRKLLAEKGYDLLGPVDEMSEEMQAMTTGRSKQSMPIDDAREKGNAAFKAGNYNAAISFYNRGLKTIISALCKGPEACADRNLSDMDFTLNLNVGMCHMKLGQYDDAIRFCEKALRRKGTLPQQQLVKALYRKADCEEKLGRLDVCLATLKELFEVEPENKAGQQLFQGVDREWNRQCKAQEKTFKSMFQSYDEETQKLAQQDKERFENTKKHLGVEIEESEPIQTIRCYNRNQWGAQLIDTVLLSMALFCNNDLDLAPVTRDAEECTIWFLGASSTFELRLLSPEKWLKALPTVKNIKIVLIGFLGDFGPDNKKVPDDGRPEKDGLYSEASDGDRTARMECYHGEADEIVKKYEMAPPNYCVIAHPGFDRYFSDFYDIIQWLIAKRTPTQVIGASAPDYSEKEGETVLLTYGLNLAVKLTQNPYKVSLLENKELSKLHHFFVFQGGLGIGKALWTNDKLGLIGSDFHVR